MGVSAWISSCHISLSVSPTVRMVFLPRLPLLMFFAFLGYCCNTQVKADDTQKSCEDRWEECYVLTEEELNDSLRRWDLECLHEGKKCRVQCGLTCKCDTFCKINGKDQHVAGNMY